MRSSPSRIVMGRTDDGGPGATDFRRGNLDYPTVTKKVLAARPEVLSPEIPASSEVVCRSCGRGVRKLSGTAPGAELRTEVCRV